MQPDFRTLQWLNPPPHSRVDEAGQLTVRTGDRTDFWRETLYGFVRDNGHFYFTEQQGDFTVEVRFRGRFEGLYDQAGLMLRLDERHWLKTGIEYTDGQQHLSAVVTNDFSDWSVLPLEPAPEEVWLRLTRLGSAVLVQYALDGRDYKLLRLAHLPEHDPVQVGVMCCSPERAGLEVTFRDFRVGPPVTAGLHGT